MKALAITGLGQLDLLDVPVPELAPDHLLIKTAATTLCTSDLIDIASNPSGLPFPTVLGHEGSGTVAALGEKVEGFQLGQKVATHPVHPCYHCPTCASGLGHLCPNMRHFGLNMPGTFAEYYVARADRTRDANSLSFSLACLTEPLCVCLEALAQARLEPGASLLILGDGPFGVMMSRLAKHHDLKTTVLAGWSDYRLSFAANASTVNTRTSRDPVALLLGLNAGTPYEAVISAVSRPETVDIGLRCLTPRGRLILFSAFTEKVPVDLQLAHAKELALVGACNDQDYLDQSLGLLSDGSWDDLVTHTFDFWDYRDALDLARTATHCHKVSLTFSDKP